MVLLLCKKEREVLRRERRLINCVTRALTLSGADTEKMANSKMAALEVKAKTVEGLLIN